MIRIVAGEIPRMTDEAEAELLAQGTAIYVRGGELVHPVHLDHATIEGVRRPAGAVMLVPCTQAWTYEQTCKVATWLKYLPGQGGRWVNADPPPVVTTTLLGRTAAGWRFPTLRGVSTTPTLTATGRLLQDPGFDPDSGMLLDLQDQFPRVPEHPTQADAGAALAVLAHPLRAMPFCTPADKAVALSAVLTALIRPALHTAPLHAFDAPTAGTGKSLLCDYIGIVKTGHTLPAMSQGKTDEENEKRLSAVLRAGDPVLLIDNCDRPLEGDFLCSLLTQEVVQARILGLSERMVLPSTSLVVASGNNIITRGDVTRRTVVCRIDAQAERPDERAFDFDLLAEARDTRGALVVAGLTVLLAYHQAGRPVPSGFKPMGSFNDWAWVRGALLWAGAADPADTRMAVASVDSDKSELLDIMHLWEQAFGQQWHPVKDVHWANDMDNHTQGAQPEGIAALEAMFLEVTNRHDWSPKAVGRWLLRHKGRMVAGKVFNGKLNPNGVMVWQLARPTEEREPGEEG